MENIQKITLDFYKNELKSIRVKQLDERSRFVQIQCTDNGQPIKIDTSVICHVKMNTPDDRHIYNNATIQDDGTVLVEFTTDMLATSGKGHLELKFIDNNNGNSTVLSTMKLDVPIEASVYSDEGIIASDEFGVLNELIIKAEGDTKEAEKAAEEAKEYAEDAKKSADNAELSESNALTSEMLAKTSENNAYDSAIGASTSATSASNSANNAKAYALQAQSYAVGTGDVRENEAIDNAKYYYEQSKTISKSLSGTLRPMGTVAFANLPSITDATEGDMYNISDQFTTTTDFKECSGYTIPMGSNVYKTSDGKWDILAGSPVSGVKGNNETDYRTGNVNLTAENVGALPVVTGNETHIDTTSSNSGFYEYNDYTSSPNNNGGVVLSAANLADQMRIYIPNADEDFTIYRKMASTSSVWEQINANYATRDSSGNVISDTYLKNANISQSSSITATKTYALDAVEKNASVEGTLANQIAEVKSIHNILFPSGYDVWSEEQLWGYENDSPLYCRSIRTQAMTETCRKTYTLPSDATSFYGFDLSKSRHVYHSGTGIREVRPDYIWYLNGNIEVQAPNPVENTLHHSVEFTIIYKK